MMQETSKDAVLTQRFEPGELFKHGFTLKSVDLIQGGTFREVIGKTVIFLMCVRVKPEGKRMFSGATVILPPVGASKVDESSVHEALTTGLEALRGTSPDDNERAFLKKYVRVIHCVTLEAADLAELVVRESDGRLVAIADGSKYRDTSVSLAAPVGLSGVRTAEDQWVPHVAGLCERCVAAVRRTESYSFIHVDETPPQNPELEAILEAVEDCYPVSLRVHNDPEEFVVRRSTVWVSWALGGKIDDAVSEIQSLELTESSRLHLLLQLMYRAGQHDETLALLQQLRPHLEGFTKSNVVQVARIAYKCGDDIAARQLLPRDLVGLNEEMWLEEGLEIATELEDDELIKRYDAQLAALFPNSERLRENRDRRLLLNCREVSVHRRHVFTTAGFSARHLEILDAVTTPVPRYAELIEKATKWDKEWLDLAVICCAMHAQTVDKNLDAIYAGSLITSSQLYGRQATQIVLSAMRALMLEGGVPQEEREYYRSPLMAVVRFLAQHPEDKDVRASFSRLLSVEACGELGLPMIAVTMLDLASEGVPLAKGPKELRGDSESGDEKADAVATQEALMRCMEWTAERGYGEFGVTVVPRELVGTYADKVIRLVSRMMLYAGGIEREDMDLHTMSHLVLVASAVRPYATTERDEDLRLLRLLAGHYTHAGRFQHARNMAEQILAIGQDTEVRRRLAWFAYADVYQRCRNPIDALVGLACAFATDTPVEKADLWQEVYAVIRVLRDLGMTELASKILPALKGLIADLGYDPETDPHIVSAELGLRVVEISRLDTQSVSTLIDDIVKACGRAKDKSDVLPLAVLLGQVVRAADERSIAVPMEARRLLTVLIGRVGARESELVESTSSLVPTTNQVVSMFNGIERAMFGGDAATDLQVVGMAARRLLNESGVVADAGKAKTLAVELLADQTMTLFGSPPELTEDWALQYALSLNDEGLDVAFMALNTAGELSVTVVSKGGAAAIEQPKHEKSFCRRMLVWLEKYPKAYGLIDAYHGNNEFFNTMEALNVRLPESEKLLIVAEPLLQQLTANLVVVQPKDGGFACFYGSQSAVGFVPALSWLLVTRARARTGKGAYRAWISADSGPDAACTLDIALARLSGTFEEFGFSVDTNRRLPGDMSDAGLVVVAAHGGLAQEGRYLHSIRDEKNLVEPPSALAASLAGVELVILFVCSGGRIDKHPWGNRTVGLPRQLLDKGVRAVVASPWPLDVKVTYTWLEPFMKAWNAGATVLQATKVANEVVAKRLGDNPQYSLAMSVYGDALMTK
ncbi:CHAT domain-containing protein [Uliginosibacterium sediminicola]|uniref:CHAT domain-containing protein n=1 Tax=Uliginosibacterium sediminicola TaxID=2024550 RepID=A0ABU9YT75_9RHOO